MTPAQIEILASQVMHGDSLTCDEREAAATLIRSHVPEVGAPVATVINNNQPGWTVIVETKPHVTLDVGTRLYAAPVSGEREAALEQAALEVEKERELYSDMLSRGTCASLATCIRNLKAHPSPQRTPTLLCVKGLHLICVRDDCTAAGKCMNGER